MLDHESESGLVTRYPPIARESLRATVHNRPVLHSGADNCDQHPESTIFQGTCAYTQGVAVIEYVCARPYFGQSIDQMAVLACGRASRTDDIARNSALRQLILDL